MLRQSEGGTLIGASILYIESYFLQEVDRENSWLSQQPGSPSWTTEVADIPRIVPRFCLGAANSVRRAPCPKGNIFQADIPAGC